MAVTEENTVVAEPELRRALGPIQLIGLGIGIIIGAGIFVSTGTTAANFAGPGVVISYLIAGFGCALAGLCYAEFSSMIPVAGSAYSYTFATFGKFLAWLIGWDLILEYLAAASAVAVGWSGYFNGHDGRHGHPSARTSFQIAGGLERRTRLSRLSGAVINPARLYPDPVPDRPAG